MKIIQSAASKLTLSYLAIIMVLSLLFSVALYRESMAQFIESTNRQRAAVTRLPLPLSFEQRRLEFIQALDDQLDADRRHLLIRLTLLNLITLLLGGGAAYILARRTLQPIQDSLEAQGRFTADASHELRTPLTAMRTEIEVALRDHNLTTADARTLLSSNLEEIAKLESLSAGLLRLAQSDNGLDATSITTVPVTELFDQAVRRHQATLTSRHMRLNLNSTTTITGDPDSLTELIAILLDNAVKYSPDGATITLTAKPAGTFVTLSVADTGIGIAAPDLPHIFDRFYRADHSRTKSNPPAPGGYGLGLSIAKRIVDLHHGTITVDSKPGRGTTFTVKLPTNHALQASPI